MRPEQLVTNEVPDEELPNLVSKRCFHCHRVCALTHQPDFQKARGYLLHANPRCWRSYRSDVKDNPGQFLSTPGAPIGLIRQMELDLMGET